MKKLLVAFSLLFVMAFTTNSVKAQTVIDPTAVFQAAAGLVNVQVGNIDITAVDVVDVSNVLNDLTIQDIQILSDILNNTKIDNVLNNLLRDAEIITGNQVVVGVVVNVLGVVEQILVADKSLLKTKKK